MKKEKIADTLITSYTRAATRSRHVFLLSNIATVIMFVAYYNLNWSWVRHLADPDINKQSRPHGYYQIPNIVVNYEWDDTEMAYKPKGNTLEMIDIRKKFIEKQGDDFHFINFGLIGAKFFVDDLPILGGFALSIIMTWYYYARRRERGVVKEISKQVELERNNNELIKYYYFGISFNLMFNTIKEIDRFKKGYIIKILFCGPVIVMFLIIFHDFIETFFLDMRGQNFSLFSYLVKEIKDPRQWVEAILRTALGLALLCYCFVQVRTIIRLSNEDAVFREKIYNTYVNIGGR